MIDFIGSVAISGVDNADHFNNFSGIAMLGSHLLMGADEGQRLHAFIDQNGAYQFHSEIDLLGHKVPEIDIEGISTADGFAYVVGSHSKARKQANKKRYDDNRDRLEHVKVESCRDFLCKFKIDQGGKLLPDSLMVTHSLRDILENDPILSRFTGIPSKENGIDIEGIAALGDDWILLGLRGPVLRGNWTPVLKVKFAKKIKQKGYELLFVGLNGLGIRDMVQVDGGVLLLAGPVGDGPGKYSIFLWNGIDCIPGEDNLGGKCVFLGELPLNEAQTYGKPEGLMLILETSTCYEILVIFDSISHGGATRYNMAKSSDVEA